MAVEAADRTTEVVLPFLLLARAESSSMIMWCVRGFTFYSKRALIE